MRANFIFYRTTSFPFRSGAIFPFTNQCIRGLYETLPPRASVDKNKQGYTILTNLMLRGDHVGFTETQNETDLRYRVFTTLGKQAWVRSTGPHACKTFY
jgi:hypothetical protein